MTPIELEQWEVERDRFGLMFSGPLEVGEMLLVVPLERAEGAARDYAKALQEISERKPGFTQTQVED